jgi:hypothetical protein
MDPVRLLSLDHYLLLAFHCQGFPGVSTKVSPTSIYNIAKTSFIA